jgi:hypothetical protein
MIFKDNPNNINNLRGDTNNSNNISNNINENIWQKFINYTMTTWNITDNLSLSVNKKIPNKILMRNKIMFLEGDWADSLQMQISNYEDFLNKFFDGPDQIHFIDRDIQNSVRPND